MQPVPSCISAVSSKSSNNNLHKVGWIKDAHGLKGEVYIRLFAKTADWLEKGLTLHLETEQGFESYLVIKAKPFKDGLIVAFEGLNNRNQSEALKKAGVYIPGDLLKSEPGERLYLNELMSFTVFDHGQIVGVIVNFSSNGPQDLLEVKRPNNSIVLIPLIDEFIEEIDVDGQKIAMKLPEGLYEV